VLKQLLLAFHTNIEEFTLTSFLMISILCMMINRIKAKSNTQNLSSVILNR